MTDRHAAYIVVLEDDIRDDDAGESVLIALRMVKGVASVEPVVADYSFAVARTRRDSAWRDALYELARQGPPGTGGST
jgi:hypothetical protein